VRNDSSPKLGAPEGLISEEDVDLDMDLGNSHNSIKSNSIDNTDNATNSTIPAPLPPADSQATCGRAPAVRPPTGPLTGAPDPGRGHPQL